MEKLIISVEEARQILGKKYDHLPNDEIENIITLLDIFAHEALDLAKKKHLESKTKKVKEN